MKKTLLPVALIALAAAAPALAVDWPENYRPAFTSSVQSAQLALHEMQDAANEVLAISRACTAAQGAESACDGLEDAREDYDRAARTYASEKADIAPARAEMDRVIQAYLGQECGPTNLFQRIFTSGISTRNCESNKERYRGWLTEADQLEASLANEAAGIAQAVERAGTEAARHQGAAATAADRAEAAERAAFESNVRGMSVAELGAHIARCRRDRDAEGCASDELGFFEQVYAEESGITLSPEQLPPVTSFEEACAAWATPDPGSAIYGSEICDPEVREGMDPAEAREAIVEFLLRGHGGRLGCNRATTRCLPTNYDTDGEADRMVGDMVVTGPAYTAATELADAPSALDSVLDRKPDGVIDCQGGAGGLFGLPSGETEAGQGVECGQTGSLPTPAAVPPAAEFIPTDHIYGQSVLGQGAEVMRGDTLGEIAVAVRRQAGRPRADLYAEPGGVVDLIAFANGIENPHLIHPDQGIRVPTGECMAEAIDAPNDEARQVLGACELLVRVSGDVPANLSVATRMARERLRRQEAEHGRFSDAARQEFLMDALNTAASPAGEFAGLSSVPAETFIEAQTGRFGIDYRPLITEVAEEAARRDYNDEERFRLLYRRLRQANAATE